MKNYICLKNRVSELEKKLDAFGSADTQSEERVLNPLKCKKYEQTFG